MRVPVQIRYAGEIENYLKDRIGGIFKRSQCDKQYLNTAIKILTDSVLNASLYDKRRVRITYIERALIELSKALVIHLEEDIGVDGMISRKRINERFPFGLHVTIINELCDIMDRYH